MNLLAEFFQPCLDAAARYDRAVGFFSSTFYALIGLSIADFAHRGGTMRVVCCPRLSALDIAAMHEGYAARVAGIGVVRELEEYLEDPVGHAVTRLLATLIAHGALDLRIAFRPGRTGIYHDKVGIFTDGTGHRVSFDGSANESWSAWSDEGNYEAFHAFTSWNDPDRVRDDIEYFESLWAGQEPGLEVVSFPAVARERLEALVDPEGLRHAEQRVRDVTQERREPRAGDRPVLRRHQQAVLEDWASRFHRGIIEHATGSGKTLTALRAVAEALDAGRSAVIVVPWVTLLEQWRDAAASYFGDTAQILLAGSGHDEWRGGATLINFVESASRRIVIATLDTAAAEDFASRLRGIPNICLVVDEVHRAGSQQRRRLLAEVNAEWRMGLSATWQREGDPQGTAVILDYFERVLDPVYTLKDALDDGFLSPYRYVIHTLSLTEHERQEWVRQSAIIARAIAAADGIMTEPARQLLIRRSKIIKKAAAKPQISAEVLHAEYEDGDAWLVYCDDTAQLRHTRQAIESIGPRCLEYHRQVVGAEGEALAEFERGGGIMLAIRCLDEGVDIPRIDHALVLASSTTRREFIQRRGRILRRADRKYQAEIHDLLVDVEGFDDAAAATFLRNELARAREFASSARDSVAARLTLDRWERYLIELGWAPTTGPVEAIGQGVEEEAEGDS
jgi:superfamily II DNA or RNA helicase